MNVRSLDDIRDLWCVEGFDSILLEARIIHDRTGLLRDEIEELRLRDAKAPRGHRKADIAGMRHGHRHILDKVRDRLESMPALSSYLLHQGMYWLVRQYFEVRDQEFKGEKRAIEYIQEHEPALFMPLERFYQITDRVEQTELFRSTAEAVLAPVGGLWKDGEVLTFGDQHKGREFLSRLLGEGEYSAQPLSPTDAAKPRG